MNYTALLRGINVSGQKLIKMEDLRASLTAAGLQNIKTYVQSGNVVFSSSRGGTTGLAKLIAGVILRDFGHEVPVIIRSAKELADVVKANPFLKEKKADKAKLHVTFLTAAPTNGALASILPLATKGDRFRCLGKSLYLYCPNGYGNTKLHNAALERLLKVQATTRNWNTVTRLLAMLEGATD